MKSSKGNIFRVTGPLWRESTSHLWIPLTKTTDAELCILICAWINNWTNSRYAGDLKPHRAHYNITVMQVEFSMRYVLGFVLQCLVGVLSVVLEILRPRQNGWRFAESIIKLHFLYYRKISNISRTKSQNLMFLVSVCNCLCAIYGSQVLIGEWRCSWSSADRRCSNYIWVINNLIAY